jgi:HK97 family phage major capsid protein
MKTELEVLESIEKKTDAFIETQTAETKKFQESQKLAEAANKALENELKQLTETLTKQNKTIEEILAAQNEFKAKRGRFSALTGEEKTAKENLAEAFAEHFEEIKAVRKSKGVNFEVKAVGTMTTSANLTGAVVNQYSLTPAIRGRRKVHMQDLVSTINSSTGLWSFYRQNNPVGEGSFGFQLTHGNAKAQIDYDLTKVDVTCEYLAGFVRIAKQMMQDLPFLQSFVANELLEDYKRQESFEFFGTLRSAATGNSTTSASVYAEKIIDWIANLSDNDYDPNYIVTTAAQWATLLKTKPNDYSTPGGVTVSPTGDVMIVGVPVVIANSLYLGSTPNKTLVGDFTKAAIIQVDGLRTEFFEQDSDNVQKNLITARTERRVGFATLRPDAFVYL